jgi:acetyltransferase
VRGFENLSETARYQRFFTPVSRLSSSQLRYLTNLDHVNHFAWGAETLDGEGVAIARYVRTADDLAEAAFTIADDYQGLGLGSFLLRALAAVASDNGIARLEMTMLADNLAMARLARSAGAEFDPPTSGTVRAELELTPELWETMTDIGLLRTLAEGAIPAA